MASSLTKRQLDKQKSYYRTLFERWLLVPFVVLMLLLVSLYSLDRWVLKPIDQQQQNLQSLQMQIDQLNNQIQHYQQFADVIEDASVNALMQAVHKVEWIDELSRYALANGIEPFSLSFADEQPLTRPQTLRLPQDEEVFLQTTITINAGLLHEGDFVRLLDKLYSMNQYLWLRSCQMTLNDSALDRVVEFDSARAMISLQCQILVFRAVPRLFNAEEW
ncbi:hypothetical protein P8S54_10775 [Thiomicrospira sp. R3]|uniref:hypothetical protein n=1 Tax=Thiomicrospira sp. R3 TaxID=3035472 RepID=UPI00259BABA6|nr:hypothetical protein [Thiomicrospira sp. R3]WFE68677.1 hypothetical protein P8S54_10775 [Thiomicrospira sp. R3]